MGALAFCFGDVFAANDNSAHAANAINQVASVPNHTPQYFTK